MEKKFLLALKKCELFDGIEMDEISSLITCLTPVVKEYNRNDFIVKSGDDFHSLGIILDGEASVYKETLSGNRFLLKKIVPGEMFGEIAAFAKQQRWPAVVQANTAVTVCFVPKDKIVGRCSTLCSFHTRLINNMIGIVSERALLLRKKIDYVSIKTMRSKLCTFLYENYIKKGTNMFRIQMNREQLAEFLNVSRPSMSRELSRMRDEGIIDFHLSTFKILDIEKLKSYCE
ncbi:MAG: Crp/Fnr family transcriptional regulator [Clostridiaceae bacterium]|nr:Crp/Fnr family transcriptional regulator [Clostridiaceae bacterium]